MIGNISLNSLTFWVFLYSLKPAKHTISAFLGAFLEEYLVQHTQIFPKKWSNTFWCIFDILSSFWVHWDTLAHWHIDISLVDHTGFNGGLVGLIWLCKVCLFQQPCFFGTPFCFPYRSGKKKKKKMTNDAWHGTCDTWHVLCAMWHMTCDTRWRVNILSKLYTVQSFTALAVLFPDCQKSGLVVLLTENKLFFSQDFALWNFSLTVCKLFT